MLGFAKPIVELAIDIMSLFPNLAILKPDLFFSCSSIREVSFEARHIVRQSAFHGRRSDEGGGDTTHSSTIR
jgi:hypothetical protein